jgi:endonuclease YncB( thermonuclease family)
VRPRFFSRRVHAGGPVRASRIGGRTALILAALALAVPLLGILGISLVGDASAPASQQASAATEGRAPQPPAAQGTARRSGTLAGATAPAERPNAAEPNTTGAVQGQDPVPAGAAAGTLRGVAEVLDTATLSVQGKVVRLFGVEWAKGAGDPDDLAAYLRGREVICRPEGATDKHRCEVQGQDLSKVVLFNGGGRATPEATPDLKSAEEHARSQQVGVWGADSLKARP